MAKKKIKKSKKRKPVKPEITVGKLVKYLAMFFIPLFIAFIISVNIGKKAAVYLQVQPLVVATILTNVFSLLIFFYIVPYIRDREQIEGIRYSILAFAIVGLGLTMPSALKGDYHLILNLPNFIANYFFITFIFSPEVLGMAKDIRKWFREHRQFILILVHLTIVSMYILGFAFMYYSIYQNSLVDPAFKFDNDKAPTYTTFVYYSAVSFATVGYGDITPVSRAARMVFGIEAILGMVVNVVFIAILLMFISGVRSEEEELEEIEKLERRVKEEEGMLAKIWKRVGLKK